MNSLNPTDFLRYLGYDDCIVMQQETRGADTKIWKVMVDEGYGALRVFRPEQASQFQFEIQAMNVASAAGIPVPAMLGFDTYRKLPFMLIEWIDGTTMMDACVTPSDIELYGRPFGALLRKMHSNTTRQDGSCLIHMDYHPLNILVDDGQIAAVIDWTNARWGHALQDVARTVSILAVSPLIDRSDRTLARRLRRIAREFLRGYGPVPHLKPFLCEAADWLSHELDHHINANGFVEPKGARRRIERWKSFNR